MPPLDSSSASGPLAAPRDGRWALAAALLGLAVGLAYANSFSGPFVFDDLAAVGDGNPSIRHLWPLGPVLSPPADHGQTVGGRPLLNLSLALNYAVSGRGVGSYHAVNLAIHLLAAWALFGVVRRTWRSVGPAWIVALLWALHPLQTEAVTYVIQRAESLMGLFYLLTLYCFIRYTEASGRPDGGRGWALLSVLACGLGMATKETMATAPILVCFYDRVFVSGAWSETWRRRGLYYAGLAATWLPLAWWVAGARGRGGTAGWGGEISAGRYFVGEWPVVVHYLRLAVWPAGLTFDYGQELPASVPAEGCAGLLLLALGVAAALAWRRRPGLSFLVVAFFALLAPTSSFLPIPVQPIAEHRMYLPLAAVVLAAVAGGRAAGPRLWWILLPVALVAGALTVRRNEDYRSALRLWGDTVAKRPDNARARCNWADALLADGRLPEALEQYEAARRLEAPRAQAPGHTVMVEILTNQGNALLAAGEAAGALAHYQEALQFDPEAREARFNLASVLLQENRLPEAEAQFLETLRRNPDYAEAHNNLATVFLREGEWDKAIQHYRENLRLRPESPFAFFNYGNALAQAGRTTEAAGAFAAALQLKPDFAAARAQLSRLQGGGGSAPRP